MKGQDAKYKTAEAASLDKTISELSGDRDTSNTELSAVVEYYGKVISIATAVAIYDTYAYLYK